MHRIPVLSCGPIDGIGLLRGYGRRSRVGRRSCKSHARRRSRDQARKVTTPVMRRLTLAVRMDMSWDMCLGLHRAAAYMPKSAPVTSAAAYVAVAEGLSSALAGGISRSRRQSVSGARTVAIVALSLARSKCSYLARGDPRCSPPLAPTRTTRRLGRSPASMRWRVLAIHTAVVLSTRRSVRRLSITYATEGFACAHSSCVAISRSQETDMCMHTDHVLQSPVRRRLTCVCILIMYMYC